MGFELRELESSTFPLPSEFAEVISFSDRGLRSERIDLSNARYADLKAQVSKFRRRPPKAGALRSNVSRFFRYTDFKGVRFQLLFGGKDIHKDTELTQLFHYYGSHSPGVTVEEVVADSVDHRQPLLCGLASLFVQRVLANLGHKTRVITSLRLDGFNRYDNGHTILEVHSPEVGWHLFDPGYGGWLKYGGHYLSGVGLHEAVVNNWDFEFLPVAYRHFGDFSGPDGQNLSFELESKWFSSSETVRWYREVFALLGIETKGSPGHYDFMVDNIEQARLVEAYAPNYHPIHRKDFMARYY